MARMLNEQEVADRADIKLATLQKIEAGKFNTPLDVMSRIATVLDCELRLVYVGQKD
jgi:DNA-binding XRE family transcriptional regulator